MGTLVTCAERGTSAPLRDGTSAVPRSQPHAAAASAGCAGRGSRAACPSLRAGSGGTSQGRSPHAVLLRWVPTPVPPPPALYLLLLPACLPAFHAEITWIFVAATIVAVFVAYGERLAPLVQGPVQPAGTPRLLTGTQLRQCASTCSGPPFTAKPPRLNEPTIGILPACGTQRAHNGGSRSVCRHWC